MTTASLAASDQDAAVGRRGHRHLLAQPHHRRALPDHRVLRVDPRTQRQVFGLEVPLSQRVADDEHGLLQRQRLLDEVERAHLDRAHR